MLYHVPSIIKKHLFVSYILFIIFYAAIYYYISYPHINKKINIVDSLYFSSTTFTAVGYGDILPVSNLAKIICITQQLILILFITSAISAINHK